MSNLKIWITGHRPNKLELNSKNGPYPIIMETMEREFKKLKKTHELTIITGMAVGIDMMAAFWAVKLNIPFIAAVPFSGQEKVWPESTKLKYKEYLKQAREFFVVCEGGYAPWKLQKRNEWMVNNGDLGIAFWDGSKGGTANCINYANSIGKPWVNLWPNALDKSVDLG